jgi:hypothetical protein
MGREAQRPTNLEKNKPKDEPGWQIARRLSQLTLRWYSKVTN